MIRVDSYEELKHNIVRWLKDYYWENNLKCFVVGVSGGIDSAVVSTLCAETGLPTYVLCMPLDSTHQNSRLSEDHAKKLEDNFGLESVNNYIIIIEITASIHIYIKNQKVFDFNKDLNKHEILFKKVENDN